MRVVTGASVSGVREGCEGCEGCKEVHPVLTRSESHLGRLEVYPDGALVCARESVIDEARDEAGLAHAGVAHDEQLERGRVLAARCWQRKLRWVELLLGIGSHVPECVHLLEARSGLEVAAEDDER